ncbi:MAG TPA: redoxin domain-containing protein [Gemmatimonadaceae bacterium]|nr:redoxin domain-containing protein [Gemmatimonadaceae bacterium]
MEAYRDQYATLFNGGNKVKVIGISVDPDTTLASWAREENFPMLFASDTGGTVGRMYFSYDEKRKTDTRTLFVVAPDGKISYIARPFNVMSQNAYTELEAAVDRAARHGS